MPSFAENKSISSFSALPLFFCIKIEFDRLNLALLTFFGLLGLVIADMQKW